MMINHLDLSEYSWIQEGLKSLVRDNAKLDNVEVPSVETVIYEIYCNLWVN